ncbi:cyclin-like protein [Rhizopogon vinicolor AM-OR11-026]|uniref:Cyclin-like protein n=1 Tax=Rhizopogon vinicolor AM-OR11-026 TaxID=1314800 RepID=A0A1B7N4N7_9AGAM|nr:cyclin-like protein [Rhizopogon vinicolor AM-OR11-026]
MDTGHSRVPSPSQLPTSFSKYHHPYFTSAEIQHLSEKQRGKLSATQEEKSRQQACAFIEAVGSKIGFPRKTLATAQNLYHRFHLFFPRKDFNYHDVALAALYVSTKMHDTLKKPREILMVSYAVRFPELAAKSKSVGGDVDMDPATAENDRQRVLAVERLILETICFNFTSKMPFSYVIKIGRKLQASKKLIKCAWRLTIDSHRTLVPIMYPPNTVALGCLYTASLLATLEPPPSPLAEAHTDSRVATILKEKGDWERTYMAEAEDLEEIAHVVIDLLIQAAQNPSANTSPRTPASPSPHPSPRNQQFSSTGTPQPPPIPYKADQLIRLKIMMRQNEHPPRPQQPLGSADPSELYNGNDIAMLGKNQGTVRFLFGPPGVVGQGV